MTAFFKVCAILSIESLYASVFLWVCNLPTLEFQRASNYLSQIYGIPQSRSNILNRFGPQFTTLSWSTIGQRSEWPFSKHYWEQVGHCIHQSSDNKNRSIRLITEPSNFDQVNLFSINKKSINFESVMKESKSTISSLLVKSSVVRPRQCFSKVYITFFFIILTL